MAALAIPVTAASLLSLLLQAAHPVATTPAASPSQAAPTASPTERPPETPAQNLKVLPRHWSRRQVVDQVMKTWTADLGVRCQYCHAGEESRPMAEWDFASDEKPAKRRAREMLLMLEEVNRRLGAMPSLHGTDAPPLRATCFTCHRGLARPRRIEEILEETRVKSGLDAAIAQYRDLRAQHLATGGYDFSVKPLLRQARARLADQDAQGAHKLLALAIEFGPDSLAIRSTLAEVAVAEGNRAVAVAHLQKALAFAQNPAEKQFVEEQLQRLLAEDPPTPQ